MFPHSVAPQNDNRRRNLTGTKAPVRRRALGPALLLESLGLKFRVAAELVSNLYDAALAPYGLTVTEHAVLFAVWTWRGTHMPTATHLASRLGLERTTVAKCLGELRRQGLVSLRNPRSLPKSQTIQDGRYRVVRISGRGKQLVQRSLERFRRTQRDLADVLSTQLLTSVFEALKVLEVELPTRTAQWRAAGSALPDRFQRRDTAVDLSHAWSRYRPLRPTAGSGAMVRALMPRRRSSRRIT